MQFKGFMSNLNIQNVRVKNPKILKMNYPVLKNADFLNIFFGHKKKQKKN